MRLGRIKNIIGVGLSLAKASFRLKNEGSYLGIFWYLLEPLLLFLIILFIQPFFVGGVIRNYPIYLLIGLIMFNFFSQATTSAIVSITSRAKFIKSIKINYESLVLSSLIQSVYSHFFEILIMIVFFVVYNTPLISVLYYLFVFIFLAIFCFGLSLILSILGVYIVDFQNVWRVLMRLLWFATPIFYVANDTKLFLLNPMYHFVNLARSLILDNMPSYFDLIAIILFSIFVLIVGMLVFNKYKSKIAEFV